MLKLASESQPDDAVQPLLCPHASCRRTSLSWQPTPALPPPHGRVFCDCRLGLVRVFGNHRFGNRKCGFAFWHFGNLFSCLPLFQHFFLLRLLRNAYALPKPTPLSQKQRASQWRGYIPPRSWRHRPPYTYGFKPQALGVRTGSYKVQTRLQFS